MTRGDADAVVYDAPILQYYAHVPAENKGKCRSRARSSRRATGCCSRRKPAAQAESTRHSCAYGRTALTIFSDEKWFGGAGGKASS